MSTARLRTIVDEGRRDGAADRLHQRARHRPAHLGRGRRPARRRLSHRALRQARPRPFRAAARPGVDIADYAPTSPPCSTACRSQGAVDRRPVDRRPDRAGALSPASRTSSPRSSLCDTAAKIGTDGDWDASASPRSSAGGIEAIADAILRALVHRRFPRAAPRRSRRLARDADPHAEAGLSRRLRRLEARRPSTLCAAIKRPDPLPGRRRGRLHAAALVRETGRP